MAGWLHGVFVGEWIFVFPLCGFSLSLFCNYQQFNAVTPVGVTASVPVVGGVNVLVDTAM